MPSPKAVLRDIADLGLDPTVAHRHTKANGRILGPGEPAPAEEPLKLALKKLPEKKAEPAKVEPSKTEEKAPEEPKKVAATVETKVETKPEKLAKKEKQLKTVVTDAPAAADDTKKV